MQTSKPRLAWRKRLIFHTLMLLLVCVIIEAASYSILVFGQSSWSKLIAVRDKAIQQEPFKPGGEYQAPMLVHPYIGAILHPQETDQPLTEGRFRVTQYGFVDDDQPIHKRAPDQVIVGVLGGSVARQMSLNASTEIAETLAKVPQFAGRTFKFVRLASNGYKQPQQLMTFCYFLTLGAEFDIVINLDGFNEATLPGIDNIPYGVFSAYPRDWGKMIASDTSPEFIRMGGYISYLRKSQRDEAGWASSTPWKFSPTVQLLWSYRHHQSERAIIDQIEVMARYTQQESPYCRSGPPQHFASPDEMYAHCSEIWWRASLLIHQLCQARGIRYFHFLQPNQYLEGSKPIGPAESVKAIRSNHPYRAAVQTCFPLMKEAGGRLAAEGVAFTDLTDAFADHPEPLYIDVCCHLDKAGDQIMARAVGRTISEWLDQESH